ncbi:uncharacterized protein LOC124181072 [Neodiprion fabricii]|uniref:uncharacterized protein LOC124181072 n=1 Tax=Neodiprion fabricii TaxID=2872261 RepID=UPI001ED8DDE1|nr:uncharacterized protein LOC124181072 [Neodiprion fabricii]
MSQCFRNISNKFTTVNSLLNTRKHVTQFDKELPHRVKPSTFLEEFLNTRSITSRAADCPNYKPQSPVASSLELLNTCDAWRDACQKDEEVERKSQFHRNCKTPVSLSSISSSTTRYKMSPNDVVTVGNRWNDSNSLLKYEIESLEKTYTRLSSGITLLKTNESILSEYEKRMILLSDSKLNLEETGATKQQSPNTDGRPNDEQLQHVFNNLRQELPKLFHSSMDFTVYHSDLQFVNNIRGTVTRGLVRYVKQVILIRTIGNMRFACVNFEILKMTIDPEDNSIKVRWRISGFSGIRTFITFWKIKLWNIKETIDQQEIWYDGFSTFYVNGEGLIYKHVADKMMPDRDVTPITKDSSAVATKLALFLGLLVPGETIPEMYLLRPLSRRHDSLLRKLQGDTEHLATNLLPLEKLK